MNMHPTYQKLLGSSANVMHKEKFEGKEFEDQLEREHFSKYNENRSARKIDFINKLLIIFVNIIKVVIC